MAKPRTIGILIFDEVEVLDFCGPFEVFSVAAAQGTPRPFDVLTIGPTREAVTTRGGLQVIPSTTLAAAPPLDLLLVPGGHGTRALMHDAAIIAWITARAATAEL
ncbi:MAG TPA: DJ-1/PfpI family protein, partial [Pirellulales bacterium]|nr:DJ-1/PfpI family protein [Pirellulales bacterium]